MKWVNCSDIMPEIDISDVPQTYIVRCKIDGGRGFTTAFLLNAEEIRDVIKDFDYCEWLDENAEPDHFITLRTMFVMELNEKGLITDAQQHAIFNYMQNK